MNYRAFAEPERRRLILGIVAEGGGVANDTLLCSGLSFWGLVSSLDEVHRSLDWLFEHGFLEVAELPAGAGPSRQVTITSRGREVVAGLKMPGIAARPEE